MLKYIVRRLLFFIPTLIVISVFAFILSVNAPGDPVARMMMESESGMKVQGAHQLHEQKQWAHRLGLDLPLFYFSIVPLSYADTLYRIYQRSERRSVKSLLLRSGNCRVVMEYHHSLEKLGRQLQVTEAPDELKAAVHQARFLQRLLVTSASLPAVESNWQQLEKHFADFSFPPALTAQFNETRQRYQQMRNNGEQWKSFIPVIHFYGNNQYHRWLFGDGHWLTGNGAVNSHGLLRGDFGISLSTQLTVNRVIASRIGWSLFFTLLSVMLAYLISIPIGIRAAVKRDSWFDHASSVVLFLLHSMPAFWVATLLLLAFANPDVVKWFPASGIKPNAGYPEGATFFTRVRLTIPFLILPLIAYTYSSLAFLSRLTRTSMLDVLQQDFIKTARAKGLPEKQVIWKHAFRNALLPLITVLANILPAAIGGSVILETIFTIPGMGLETYEAIQRQDYPVIIGVFTLTGVLTLIGYLLADILYCLADPRISFSKKLE